MLPVHQKVMLIFHVLKGHVTKKVTHVLEENNRIIVQVPNNMTDQFQLLDLTVAQARQFTKGKLKYWYDEQISKELDDGRNVCDIQVPLKLLVIKRIHAKWLLGLYGHLQNSPDSIIEDFKMAGIKDALKMELPLEDPFTDLNGWFETQMLLFGFLKFDDLNF